eukprot:TRINITY_DN421_c0_g1_i10.p1 TRINITY_DN421_c0_g1~~TRINITY_DN421_c0_g1_i10.p1  ORF type:complete len:466 (+),score=56.33 TRINITY_DN421_c0_g1_i10:124-1521(+)
MSVGFLDVKYSAVQASLKGEDVLVAPQRKVTTTHVGKCAVFAVCDGHGGDRAAIFVGKRLEEVLERNLDCDLFDHAKRNGIESVARVFRQCLRATFSDLETEFLMKNNSYAGTTVTVVIVCGRLVSVANVGDSKAVLVLPNGEYEDLTDDHRIHENAQERIRMIRSGATISKTRVGSKYLGVLRIQPAGLALSRSIGDRLTKPFVLASPYISQVVLPDDSKSRIIMASDGLWDEFSSQEVVDIARSAKLAQLPSKLVRRCRRARSGYLEDDTSVMAISLKPHQNETTSPRSVDVLSSQKNLGALSPRKPFLASLSCYGPSMGENVNVNSRQVQAVNSSTRKAALESRLHSSKSMKNLFYQLVKQMYESGQGLDQQEQELKIEKKVGLSGYVRTPFGFSLTRGESPIPILRLDTSSLSDNQVSLDIQRCSVSSATFSSYSAEGNFSGGGCLITPTKFMKKETLDTQ